MSINSIGNFLGKASFATTDETGGNKNISTLDMEDFLQLFAAQLKYQDMSSPMDNAQMMQQLTQVSSVTAMDTMANQMDSIVKMTSLNYAASLIGKEITVSQDSIMEAPVKGTVTGSGVYNNEPCVYIDGIAYGITKIMTVGNQ